MPKGICAKNHSTHDYAFGCEHFYSAVRDSTYMEYRLIRMVGDSEDDKFLPKIDQYICFDCIKEYNLNETVSSGWFWLDSDESDYPYILPVCYECIKEYLVKRKAHT